MNIRRHEEEDVAVISLFGDIDMEEVVNIRNTISAVIHDSCCQFVLDMSRVQHINVTGIGILTESLCRVRHMHGDIKLAGLNAPLRQVFHLLELDKFFQMYANSPAAVRSFKAMKCAAA